MSIHIYENGAVGAQDGTEVTFLHFDGGTLADGATNEVTKSFYVRTDGEEIKDVCYTIALVDEENPAQGITDKVFLRLINSINSADGVYSGKYTAFLKKIDGNNICITVKAIVRQIDGVSNMQGKLYFWKISDAVEVINNV